MGIQSSSDSKRSLRVANLNFSGFELSPFQYYSNDHFIQQKQLNDLFINQMNQLKGDSKQLFTDQQLKAMAKIDKKIKQQRYSPLYNKRCGIIKGKFYDQKQYQILKQKQQTKKALIQKIRTKINFSSDIKIQQTIIKTTDKYLIKLQQIFNLIWDSTLELGKQWLKIQPQSIKAPNLFDQAISQEQYKFYQFRYIKKKKQLDNLRKFDFIVYITILKYVYEKVDLETIVNSRSCSKYLEFMIDFFSKPHLDENKKIWDVIKLLRDKSIDVLFVQQATDQLCSSIQKWSVDYRIIRSPLNPDNPGRTIIILKQQSFDKASVGRKGNLKIKQIIDKLADQDKKRFLQWGKSAVISIGNFILMSVAAKRFDDNMKNNIKSIRKKFPLKYVIIGATFSDGQKIAGQLRDLQQNYQTFPKNKITCIKKRTHIQFQKRKADLFITSQYNHIIYDKRLELNNNSLVKLNLQQKQLQDGIYSSQYQQISQDVPARSKHQTNNLQSQQNNAYLQQKLNKLPNDTHLFDQLIVVKNFSIPKKIQSKSMPLLKKQDRQRLGFETSSSEQDDQKLHNDLAFDS